MNRPSVSDRAVCGGNSNIKCSWLKQNQHGLSFLLEDPTRGSGSGEGMSGLNSLFFIEMMLDMGCICMGCVCVVEENVQCTVSRRVSN